MSGKFPWLPVFALLALWLVTSHGCGADVLPVPAPEGPNLVPVFAKSDDRAKAKHDAKVFGTICRSVARAIEFDGKQPNPRFSTGVKLDDLRIGVREVRMEGYSFGREYPDLKNAVEEFMVLKVGKSGGPIDDAKRAAWVEAMNALADSAEYAAGAL